MPDGIHGALQIESKSEETNKSGQNRPVQGRAVPLAGNIILDKLR